MTTHKPTILRETLADFYLEFVNDYLTAEKMGNDYGLSEQEAMHLIVLGCRLHEQRVEEYKQERAMYKLEELKDGIA